MTGANSKFLKVNLLLICRQLTCNVASIELVAEINWLGIKPCLGQADVLACFHISRYLIPGFQSHILSEIGLADNYMTHMS